MSHDTASLVRHFEDATLPLAAFRHEQHVQIAWHYLRSMPALDAIRRMADGLQRYARAHGRENLYHETITWACVLLIQERRECTGRDVAWEGFRRRNSDLLTWKNGPLRRYYREATLASPLARRIFVLPDAALEHPASESRR